MSKVAFVNGKDTLRRDRLVKAIPDALVQVTCLVVHARHDRVCKD